MFHARIPPCLPPPFTGIWLLVASCSTCRIVAATGTLSSTQAVVIDSSGSQTSGLCASVLSSVIVESLDPRRLLGMVNVASALSTGYQLSPQLNTGTHWAFVAGIDDYLFFSKLDKSVNDAKRMASLFSDKGFSVVSALNPTRSQFMDALEIFCRELPVTGVRSVLVHYSGHGVAPTSESFLAAVDSSPSMCGLC
jgi:hypothetical protein